MGQQCSFKRTNLTLEETTEFVHYWSICGLWFGRALDTKSSQRVHSARGGCWQRSEACWRNVASNVFLNVFFKVFFFKIDE